MEDTLVQSRSLKHAPRQLPTGRTCGIRSLSGALAAISMALTVLVACSVVPVPTPTTPPTSRTGTALTDFDITVYQSPRAREGDRIRFTSLLDEGKPLVVAFWAGLCPPCRAELPDVQEVYEQYSSRVAFFGLDVGALTQLGSEADAKSLIRKLGVTFPAGGTSSVEPMRTYKVIAVPTTLFLLPDGTVLGKWTGLLPKEKLVELTEKLIEASNAAR